MEWPIDAEPQDDAPPPGDARRRILVRRIGALVFVAVFLLDVLVPAAEVGSRLCGLSFKPLPPSPPQVATTRG